MIIICIVDIVWGGFLTFFVSSGFIIGSLASGILKTINTKNAPQAIGPYSQAKIIGNFVFTSGQIPLKPDGSIVSGNFEKESNYRFYYW